MTSMNNKVFAIVGTLTFLASLGMLLFARWQTEDSTMKIPRVTVLQTTGYLRVFDVTFESQEQIDTLIANNSREGASPGRLPLLDFYSSYGLAWYARHDDSPVIRIDAGSKWGYFSRDQKIGKLLADDFVEKLEVAGVEGAILARSVPVIECRWFSDGVARFTEMYLADLQITEGSKRNREDNQYYQLLDEGRPIDCSATARAYREFYDVGVASAPFAARVPNLFTYGDDPLDIRTSPEYLFQ